MFCKILFLLVTAVTLIDSSFINVYPKYERRDTVLGDVGEPLLLTPFIQSGALEMAKKLAMVTHDKMSSVPSYSGYLTVNKQYNSNLFFWYFPAAVEKDSPVVLWLQGGPGASSLFGLFAENGPFYIKKNGTLAARKYSWHKNHHLIYIDNPVGTGYSFTDKTEGYSQNEKEVGQNLYEALSQFFDLFTELRPLSFFVTGESYAGKYVPAVGYKIHMMNKRNDTKHINLKGLAIGNGLSDPLHQLKYGDYLFQIGLIDKNGLQVFHEYEKRGKEFIGKGDYDSAFKVFDELINMDQLPSGSIFKNMTGFSNYFNYLESGSGASGPPNYLGDFIQRDDVRKAIHVGNMTFHDTDTDNLVEKFLQKDVMSSVAILVSELLSNYRMVIYNGQLDIIVAYPLTVNYLLKLKFADKENYLKAPRYIWRVDNEIAGYAKEAGNLCEVLVRNAGHMVPADQPKWALDMLLRLTSGKKFGY